MAETLSFVACPNHDTNVGWNQLQFISMGRLKCNLCGREFSYAEIQRIIRENYEYDLQNLQRNFASNMCRLYAMNSRMLDEHVD